MIRQTWKPNLNTLISRSLAAVAALSVLSGCSNLFGSGPKENQPLEIQQKSVVCLKDAKSDIQKYAEDGSGDIGRAIDCTVTAIDEFTAQTQGATSKSLYTRGELANFIEQYLTAADSRVAGDSPAYTEQGLNLKQLVLGGSGETVTRAEIAKIKSLLLRARPILVSLGPDIRVVLMNADKATSKQVANAKDGVNRLADLLAVEFDRAPTGRPDWKISEIVSAFRRLEIQSSTIESWLPLAKVAKTMLLGGEEDSVRPTEWARLLRTGSRAYNLALEIKYQIKDNKQWLGSGLPAVERAINEALSLADQGLAANGGSIEGKRLQKLIELIDQKKMLPPMIQGLRLETAKNLVPIILGKLLCGSYSSDCARKSTDLLPQHVGRLRLLAFDWLAGQKTINVAFARGTPLDVKDVERALGSRKIDVSQFGDKQQFQVSLRAQQQLIGLFGKGRPPILDDEGRLVVRNKLELPKIKKSDVDKINALRIVVMSVLQGWTTNRTNFMNLTGLTEGETHQVYMDLTPLGRDLKWMDARNTQAGVRTFMETSIFMSSSNNDGFLNLSEGVEWFSFVMSGGMLADRMFKAEFESECGLKPTADSTNVDIFDRPKLDAACFRRRFLAVWPTYLSNLPNLVSWAKADGSGQRSKQILEALESAARNKGLTNDPVESSEFRSMIPVAQYMESIFARFDQNRNSILDHDEVWATFPLLQGFIKKMGKGSADSEEIQRTLLSYILQYGECPEPTMIDKAWVAYWVLARRFQNDEADRVQILRVIASFGIANRKERTRTIEAYYEQNKNSLRALLSTGAATDSSAAAKLTELFQCQKPAVPILAELMQRPANLDKLVPASGPTRVQDFIARIKFLTERNKLLQVSCLPF